MSICGRRFPRSRPVRRLGLALLLASTCAATAHASFVQAPGSPYDVDSEPYSVTPGQFTGDSLLDLAVVNGTSSTAEFYNQISGSGGFTLAPGSPFAVGSGANFSAPADYNGDGREDIAISNYLDGTVSVFLHQANDSFTLEGGAAFGIGGFGATTGAIATGDFNGDGKADIVVSDYTNDTVRTYLRKGTNDGFVFGTSIGSGGSKLRYIAVGDLDGAGGPDVAVTNADNATVGVLLGQPGGSFVAAAGSPYAVGTQPQFVTIARLSGDARPDLAVANRSDNNVTVLTRTDSGFAPAPGSPYGVGVNPVGIAAADLRQTGRNDLVVANGGSGGFSILENDGTTFTRGTDVPVARSGVSPYGIATGQFNDGDPFPDVAVTSVTAPSTDNTLDVFLNRPAAVATTQDATGVTPSSATLNATVNPRGSDTDAYFEYGPTAAYGSRAPAGGDLAAGSDLSDHAISRGVDGLAPATEYHYRIVTKNEGGVTNGADKSFTTAPPAGPPVPESSPTGPPQAYLSAPSSTTVGTSVTLSAEGSTPADVDLTYALDLDGNGSYETSMPKGSRSLTTTFTQAGAIKIGLQVTDAQGRSDAVRRTVLVSAPRVYSMDISPKNPKKGDNVRFTLRELIENPANPGSPKAHSLANGTLTTMEYDDGTEQYSRVGGILVAKRDASATGNFQHVFDRSGTFTVHATVDDGKGYKQSVDVPLKIGSKNVYTPAIVTNTTTVGQGNCVFFRNGTFSALPVEHTGPEINEDINPKNRIIIQAPPDPSDIVLGGGINFEKVLFNPALILGSQAIAGSPKAQLNYNPGIDLSKFVVGNVAANFNFRGARPRQAEPTLSTDGQAACDQETYIESSMDIGKAIVPPYPKGADKGWPPLPTCDGKRVTTTTTRRVVDPTLAKLTTTRYTWYSLNKWDFGDGERSGVDAELPSYEVYHPYDKGGDYTVKLTTTYPADLDTQLADAQKGCASGKPMDPRKPDGRFDTTTTSLKIHVKAKYDRIKSRGLWMTTEAKSFDETDLPGVYESAGPIFINTRRVGTGYDPKTQTFDYSKRIYNADGVLVVIPTNGPLRVVAATGEIIGAANLAFQGGNGNQTALGPVPLNIRGTPGLVIPPAGSGGTHDFGVFRDPPARLGSGSPGPGEPFHINTAHVVLREADGGKLALNVNLPEPFGPNGQSSTQTITQDFRGNGRRSVNPARFRGLLDNFDLTIPAITFVPGVVSFDGGKLSHHSGRIPPAPAWEATGSLSLFGKKVSMSPDSATTACPVEGGLAFSESGKLLRAGALVSLKIPIPNPPLPPAVALQDPALVVYPGSSTRPLDLFGCLSIADYPADQAYRVTGCAGVILANDGVSVANSEELKFCPDTRGNTNFTRDEHNSYPDPVSGSRRIMKGVVVRATGTVGLGPKHWPVASAYIQYGSDPFQVIAAGHVGMGFDVLGGRVDIGADVFGYFRSTTDWAISGQGGITQTVLCAFGVCPSADIAVLVAYAGVGACVDIAGASIGGALRFSDLTIFPHVLDCDADSISEDLGVDIQFRRFDDFGDRAKVRQALPVQSAKVKLPGGRPSATIIVNGTTASPIVQVRDPKGRLVLDDNGKPVQGLTFKSKPAPARVDVLAKDPPAPKMQAPNKEQGILHNESTTDIDANLTMRNSTIIKLREPLAGEYTITTKNGSAPITAVHHTAAKPYPTIKGGVVSAKNGKRMLTVTSKLPAGSTLELSEEADKISRKLTSAKAAATSPTASTAQVTRHVPFTPALGPGGRRRIVATVLSNGIPTHRVTIASYTAPSPKKAGKVRSLRARVRGNKLNVSWKPAANATRYVVTLKLPKRTTIMRTAGAKARGVTVDDALVRSGVTVQVRAIGPLASRGPTVTRFVKKIKVKKIKDFVL